MYVLLCCAGDYYDRWNEFLSEVTPLVRDGKIKHEETVMQGFEKLPEALAGLFKGINIGKVREKMGDEESDAADQQRLMMTGGRMISAGDSRCHAAAWFPDCNCVLMRQMIVKVQE